MKSIRADELKKGDVIMIEVDDSGGYGFTRQTKEVFGKVKGVGRRGENPMFVRFYNYRTKQNTRLQVWKESSVEVLDEDEAALMAFKE